MSLGVSFAPFGFVWSPLGTSCGDFTGSWSLGPSKTVVITDVFATGCFYRLSWCSLGLSCASLGAIGSLLGRLWMTLGSLGVPLGLSWASLVLLWSLLV